MIPAGRLWLLYLLLVLLATAILLRMAYIYMERSQDYLSQGERRSVKAVVVPATKGVVADRNGEVLAVTTVLYALAVDLNHLRIKKKDSVFQQRNAKQRIKMFKKQLSALSKVLKKPPEWVLEKTFMQSPKKARIYIAKGLLPEQIVKIKSLKMPALVYERTLKRYYPHGEVLANVIGFSDYVDKGRSGVEKYFDGFLRGKDGKISMRRDRVGRVTSYISSDNAFKKGRDLNLTLDTRVQSIAFFALQRAIKKYHAKSGTVVVLKARTGKVLAMANLPSYNPNDNRQRVGSGQSNIASQELFEPGSIIKPFTALAGLEYGVVQKNTLLHIGKGQIHKIKIADRTYKDSSRIDKQAIGIGEMLQKSSNVGAIKLGMQLKGKDLRSFFMKVGFGVPTGISLYGGEFSGVVAKPNEMTPVRQASMSMGYALNASVLQMARAYAMLANGGRSVTLQITDQDTPEGVQVASPENVAQIVRWLEQVPTEDGTAPLAKVPGFKVAGKTGTALISKGRSGYAEKKYIASFIGFAPSKNPEIVVAVLIEHPKGKVYYGGAVAAPVFSEVTANTLNYLGVRSTQQKSLVSVLQGGAG